MEADVSVKAVAAYPRLTSCEGFIEVSFVFGKAKLAPQPDVTVPRLELRAAVLAVEIAEMILAEMDLKVDSTQYYTDSKVVLGYIRNQSRRFYVYVNNRVQRIHQTSSPAQWYYVPTDLNPADHGSRSVTAALLRSTTWLTAPSFLKKPSTYCSEPEETFGLVDPASDCETRPVATVNLTSVSQNQTSSNT